MRGLHLDQPAAGRARGAHWVWFELLKPQSLISEGHSYSNKATSPNSATPYEPMGDTFIQPPACINSQYSNSFLIKCKGNCKIFILWHHHSSFLSSFYFILFWFCSVLPCQTFFTRLTMGISDCTLALIIPSLFQIHSYILDLEMSICMHPCRVKWMKCLELFKYLLLLCEILGHTLKQMPTPACFLILISEDGYLPLLITLLRMVVKSHLQLHL